MTIDTILIHIEKTNTLFRIIIQYLYFAYSFMCEDHTHVEGKETIRDLEEKLAAKVGEIKEKVQEIEYLLAKLAVEKFGVFV